MLQGVEEVWVGRQADPDNFLRFWTYMICPVESSSWERYHLIRIDNVEEEMQCLARECPLSLCREIILKHEPEYEASESI